MATTVEYDGAVVATIPSGNKATIPVADKQMKTDIVITVPKAEGGTDSPLPIEVSTEAEMTALLESGEVGGVYKYTGTTGTYENGALYVLEVETYTITVNKRGMFTGARPDIPTYIKFGSVPTSASDYDYSSENYYSSSETTLGTVEASVAYVWGGSFYVDGVDTSCGDTYDTATEITFAADTTVSLVNAYGSGGSG